MMKTLCIYYIATDIYKKLINQFSENIHLFMPKYKKTIIILSRYAYAWYNKESDKNDGLVFAGSENKNTNAYIYKYTPYTYVLAAFFLGSADMIYLMCSDVINMVNNDLKHNIIPKYHDESYLNKWCLDNKNKIIILPLLRYECTNNDNWILYYKKFDEKYKNK